MRLSSVFSAALLLGGMALQAQAVVGWGNIQWPLVGSTQPNGTDITVYSQVWKDGCTDMAGACADLQPILFYKAPSEAFFTGVGMTYNTDLGSNDEYQGDIPASATMESQVEFYVEYLDTSDLSLFYPDGFNSANPAFYNLTNATQFDFDLTLCVDLSCVGVGSPAVSGTFNGWSGQALNPTVDPDIWCTTVMIPAGSAPDLFFKFNNPGVNNWEDVDDRLYSIAPGATEGSVDVYWNNDDSCDTADTQDTPTAFALSAAYPNPFNPSTTIAFQTAETGFATLRVTDLTGRTVSTLINERLSAGAHNVVFDASSLASGVYFYTLESAGQLQTRKMVLLK